MRCMVKCTPIKVLYYYNLLAHDHLIIFLPYDHTQPTGSHQFAYKYTQLMSVACQALIRMHAMAVHRSWLRLKLGFIR